jgi:hypothetical protein
MNYRCYKFFAKKNFTADTTIVEDLDLVDPISSLIVQIDLLNAAATMTAHPVGFITKLEIVDGSDVIYSLDGYEMEALDWYNSGGKLRSSYNAYLNGSTINRSIGIQFGRYEWDRELALDPKKFTNLQIRISIDINGGGMSCASAYVTMFANLFDQRSINPTGFLMTKEIKKWTISSAVHEYTDLPLDYPYRNIYVRGFVLGTEGCQSLSNIKISEDQDKKIPFDLGPADIVRGLAMRYPYVEEDCYFATDTSTRYIFCTPSERVTAFANTWAAAAGAYPTSVYDGDGGYLKIITATAGSNVNVHIRGHVPHCVYEIPCGDPNDISDWYDVRSLGRLRADITGAGTAAGSLFIQQYRTY